MSTSNVVTQDEFTLAEMVGTAITVGTMAKKIAVVPAEIAGVRVMTLVADMDGVDEQGGTLPVAVVVNAALLDILHPTDVPPVLEGQEDVA